MGVIPEPALCADDVSRLVPNETILFRRPGPRPTLKTKGLRHRTAKILAAGFLLATGLPQSALAPAALAHDRIDFDVRRATAAVNTESFTERGAWSGVPVIEQEPPTLALIETDLASLPQPAEPGDGDSLRFGDMTVPRPLVEAILRASEETGVDPVYMMALADKESSFSTTVKASTSSAEGLFQFLSGTWLEVVRQFGRRHGLDAEAAAVTGRGRGITVSDDAMRTRVLALRQDPYVAALMAGELIKRDRDRIAQRIGRDLKTSELYLAHFLGTASAGRFLTLTEEKPAQVAKAVFKSAAKANRSLFTQKEGKGRRGLTVTELRHRIDGMIDRRLNQYEGVAALGAAAPRETAGRTAPVPGVIRVSEALP
ncbi:transglycosylase SLT domain-containing protein [Methylobacterium sp. Leaf108]|uniref:transglycosylase SLT domain-containing protein n=1 Tax=Methylobacterium sp. Leaf108 TaxID=1736256 RepID=UPI0006F6A627|nr:transglycosylase SLT domain-containing protein [Methylobacterium sp. Leaf108]KQP50237.1 lytic transglycosylase [Methylobacterium sp. Leaf108]